MSALLTLQDIYAGYSPRISMIKGLSLEIEAAESVAVVGPNAAGKSTLVRTASRTLKPHSGNVQLSGQEIWELSARDFAKRVAVVPQETSISFDRSVLEIVLLGRHPHVGQLHIEDPGDESVALTALDAVGVIHLAEKSILEVSGGEKQRIIIAKALAQVPELLILDEPTAHLDVAQQVSILSLTTRLAKERGIAVVAVLHDLNLAAAWGERLIVLDKGTIAADGPPEQVLTETLLARVWETRMWVRNSPLTGRPFLLPLPPPYEPEQLDDQTLVVHVICGGGTGGPVLAALVREGYRVTCGVLNVGDSDEELCRAMSIPHVSEAPFSPISPERERSNIKMIKAADIVVMTEFCVGPGNISNLHAAVDALMEYKRVVLVTTSDSEGIERAADGGKELIKRIQNDATKVESISQLLSTLRSFS